MSYNQQWQPVEHSGPPASFPAVCQFTMLCVKCGHQTMYHLIPVAGGQPALQMNQPAGWSNSHQNPAGSGYPAPSAAECQSALQMNQPAGWSNSHQNPAGAGYPAPSAAEGQSALQMNQPNDAPGQGDQSLEPQDWDEYSLTRPDTWVDWFAATENLPQQDLLKFIELASAAASRVPAPVPAADATGPPEQRPTLAEPLAEGVHDSACAAADSTSPPEQRPTLARPLAEAVHDSACAAVDATGPPEQRPTPAGPLAEGVHDSACAAVDATGSPEQRPTLAGSLPEGVDDSALVWLARMSSEMKDIYKPHITSTKDRGRVECAVCKRIFTLYRKVNGRWLKATVLFTQHINKCRPMINQENVTTANGNKCRKIRQQLNVDIIQDQNWTEWKQWYIDFKFSSCRTAECFTQVTAEDDVIRAGVCKYCKKVVHIFKKEENDNWILNLAGIKTHRKICKPCQEYSNTYYKCTSMSMPRVEPVTDPNEWPEWFTNFATDISHQQARFFLPVPVEITDKRVAVCKECNRDVVVYERKGEKWIYKVNNFYEHKEKCPPVKAVIDGMHEASKACAISKNRNKTSKCVVLLEDCRNSA